MNYSKIYETWLDYFIWLTGPAVHGVLSSLGDCSQKRLSFKSRRSRNAAKHIYTIWQAAMKELKWWKMDKICVPPWSNLDNLQIGRCPQWNRKAFSNVMIYHNKVLKYSNTPKNIQPILIFFHRTVLSYTEQCYLTPQLLFHIWQLGVIQSQWVE